MRLLLLTLVSFCHTADLAEATNNYFLPGDAFFSVAIPQALIESWSASTEPEFDFHYSRFDGEFFACGSIGYSTLRVDGITPEFRLALTEAYWRYVSDNRPMYREEGEDGKSVLEQTNSVVAMIYNRKANVGTLGLKYNEDWAIQGGGHYSGLFETAKPVSLDWRHGATVPPLAVREKLDPAAHLSSSYEVARTVDNPLHISCGDVEIVLVGFAEQKEGAVMQRCPNLQSIFDYEEESKYMKVSGNSILSFYCGENGLWTETVIAVPVSSGSWIPKSPLKPK